jgi:branched-chain amino acid transport system permease protein
VSAPVAPAEALARLARRLNGPQSLGASRVFWLALAGLFGAMLAYPAFAEAYSVANTAYLLVWAFLALSVSILWGFTGVFSFGQTAFFGLAGYAYGVVAINLSPITGETGTALVAAVLLAALVSLAVGYIMFYGGVSSLYVAIFTMMLTLLAETFANQTSGPQYRIGTASLGGSNGMVAIPPLQIGFAEHAVTLTGGSLYYLVLISLGVIYLGLRALVNSSFGYVMVAAREDPQRTEMLGYDVRRVNLVVFVLAGALAGFSGVLFVSWNNFIAPSSMGLTAATLPVIWVAAGGRKSLLAVVLAAVILQWINQQLAYSGSQYSLLFFALLILATVMVFPDGIVPTLARHYRSVTARAVRR